MTGVNKTDAYQGYNSYQAGTEKTAGKAVENKTSPLGVQKTEYGKTVGEPKLSKEAQRYYEKLQKKFGQYDFILVSKDQKANAQANASKYANGFKTVVLIDEEKIERMATDANYRKKYEGILSGADKQLQQLKASIEKSGANVQGYGMQVDDGGTMSFFAVLKKSSDEQKVRIEKAGEKKRAERKAAEKKAAKKAEEKRIQKKGEEKIDQKDPKVKEKDDDTVTITANSAEELMRKINDFTFNERSNLVQTESEKALGQNIDFRG